MTGTPLTGVQSGCKSKCSARNWLWKNKEKNLLFVCNFTPVEREDYRVGVPTRKTLKLVLNSDEEKYGGKGEKRPLTYKPVKKECDGQAYSIAYPLPAYGVAVFEY